MEFAVEYRMRQISRQITAILKNPDGQFMNQPNFVCLYFMLLQIFKITQIKKNNCRILFQELYSTKH